MLLNHFGNGVTATVIATTTTTVSIASHYHPYSNCIVTTYQPDADFVLHSICNKVNSLLDMWRRIKTQETKNQLELEHPENCFCDSGARFWLVCCNKIQRCIFSCCIWMLLLVCFCIMISSIVSLWSVDNNDDNYRWFVFATIVRKWNEVSWGRRWREKKYRKKIGLPIPFSYMRKEQSYRILVDINWCILSHFYCWWYLPFSYLLINCNNWLLANVNY